MDLHGPVGDTHRRLRGVQLGHRGGACDLLPRILHKGSALHQKAGGADLHGGVGEHPLHRLKVCNRLIELLAALCIGHRLLERSLRDADTQSTDTDPPAIQDAQGVDEPLSFLPKAVVIRHPAVLHDDFRRVGGSASHFVLLSAGPEPLHPLLENEGGDSVLPLAFVADREDDRHVADRAVCRERLAPVQDPTRAVPYGGRACSRRVAAGGRLGQAPGADRHTSRQGCEVTSLLLFRARDEDVVGTERIVRRHGKADRAVHARELFDDEDIVQVGEAGATVFRRKEDPEHSHVPQFLHDVARELLCLVQLEGAGCYLLLGEPAYRLAGELLLLGQMEFQGRPPEMQEEMGILVQCRSPIKRRPSMHKAMA